MTTLFPSLKPRKAPVQARATASIEALRTAAIQVLVTEGLSRCTTTRIAVRAGVSVGSLYQYFPNRDALLAAVLREHLSGVGDAVEQVCREQHGKAVAEMGEALVRGFLSVKLRDPVESKALYAVAGERGGPALVAESGARSVSAIATMLESATDAHFDDPPTAAAITMAAMTGPVRSVLDGHASPGVAATLETQLVRLVTAYLETYRTAPAVMPAL